MLYHSTGKNYPAFYLKTFPHQYHTRGSPVWSGVQFRTVQYHGMERIDELFDGTVRGMERIDDEAARGQYDLVMYGLDWIGDVAVNGGPR